MVAKILVATDGSKASDAALDYSIELAKLYEGELIILNVIRTDVITTYRQIDRDFARKKVMDEREENSKRVVGRALTRAERTGVKAVEEVRHGEVDTEIVNFARGRDDIMLLVMGAFGKNFIERQVVGSKTEGVLRNLTEIDMPLIVVPHPCKICGSDVLKKILVAVDGSDASFNALEQAVDIANMYDGEILVMNVVRRGIRESIASINEDREERSRNIIDKSIELVKEHGANAEGIVRKGFVDKEIVNFVKSRDDIVLVVMGAYGKNFLERQMVGSKTQGVLRKIPELDVPLAVIPSQVKKQPIEVPIT
jgi:nucleotide-binding universal stress UspA family protein